MTKRDDLKRSVFLNNYRGQSPIIFQKKNSRGQVWVETVIYLLIAFVMMGLVLSFIRPKIEELRDKTIIEQSLEIIKEIDNSIITIGSSGNKRLVEVGIRKGSLIIDSENDDIIFEMESRYIYTETNTATESAKIVQIGNIQALTEKAGRSYLVTLKRDFSDEYNLTYNDAETLKTLTKASNPYRLFFTNKGESSDKIVIDFNTE